MSAARRLGLAAAVVGAAGAAVAGGVAAQRHAVRRARGRVDPFVDEPLGKLHTEGIEILACDGVPLRVELDGDLDGELTIVFAHGFALSMDSYHFQRRELGDLGRLVFYDQRSHGASGPSPREHCTIDQLGRDLYDVLHAVAPRGPVVLVGHSMGGMTILALADQHPELFGERIVGVALLSTSTGEIAKALLGLPGWAARLFEPTTPFLAREVGRRATVLERTRRLGGDFTFLLTRYISYGPDVPPSLVEFMERMLLDTPVDVMANFFDTFLSHDKLKALDELEGIPTAICCGERDVLTPLSHSELMAAALPDAEYTVVPGAGHMALIDRYPVVNGVIRRLARRALDAAAAPAAQ